jgi:hypothetical protein
MNNDLVTIKKTLNSFRIRYTLRLLANEISIFGAAFFLFSAIITILFALFPWVILPPVWDVSIVLTIVALLWKILDSSLFHPMSLHDVAAIIEKRSAKSHMLPGIALELETSDHSNSFVCETFRTAAAQLGSIDRRNALPEVPRLPKVLLCGSVLLWIIGIVFCRPSLPEFWKLPLTISQNNEVSILPGSVRVPLGSPVTLKLIPKGIPLPSTRLLIVTDNSQKRNTCLLRPDSSGSFKFIFEKLSHDIHYQFSYGGTTCKPESIQIVPQPMIMGLRISATPPAYMASEKLLFNDEWGDVSVPAGSDVSIKVVSTELSDAKLVRSADSLHMICHGDTASVSFKLKSDLTYSFAFRNIFGIANDSLPLFHISVLPDEPPFVQIVRPATSKALNVNQVETLWVDAVDDYCIQSLYCQWFTNNDKDISVKKIGPKDMSKECRTEFIWNLKDQSLYPGDTLYYWIKARDTRPDIVQEAFSDTFAFRVPGFEEIQRNIAENGEYVSEKISEVQNKQDKLNNTLKNLAKNNTGNDELNWEKKQALKDVQQEFNAQADTLQKALDALQESVEKLRDEGVLNEDILSKIQEIEKALKELIAQYGDSLMKMPDQQDRQLSMSDMKEAIEKTQEMLPELESRLDNTMKFLELLKKDQELAMMAAQAEKFAKEQLDLKQEQSQSSSDFASRQQSLMDRIKSFSDTLKQKMNNLPEVASSLQKVDEINQRMQMSTDKDGKPKNDEMSKMSSSLINLSDQLRQQMSSEKMKQVQRLKATLLSLATDLFTIIDWNAQIVSEMKSDSEKEIALSHQALIQSTHQAQEKIDTLKALPPQIQQQLRTQFRELYRQSGDALQATGSPEAFYMMLSEEQAIRDLTETVITILERMSSQNSSSSSGSMSSMMEQLQKLSGKQGAINSAVSDLLRSMMSGNKPGNEGKNGSGEKPGGMSESQAKARQEAENAQRALADQLDQLAKKFGNENSGEGSSMGKRMEELENEARRLAEKLRNPPDTDLRDRQDRFLSKMLQATLSMHHQDEGKEERKSKSATNLFTDDKTGTVLSDSRNNPDAFYSIRRRALESKFPANYRTAIKTYFDSLGVMYLKK